MKNIIANPTNNPTTLHKTGRSSRLVLHYIIDSKPICEAEHQLTPDTRFIEIPIPVIHQMTRRSCA